MVKQASGISLQAVQRAETNRLLLCVDVCDANVCHLAAHGWRCHHVADVPRALQAASALHPDALLVGDAALAGAMAQRLMALREASSGALIVVARQADEIDEIMALELGADDYVAAPVTPRRLRARLSAAVRTSPTPAPHVHAFRPELPALSMVHSGWRLDVSQALLRGHGRELRLSTAQASLLALLLESAGVSSAAAR
jgi:DNA-binding response OmpR family regulator